MKTLIFVLSFLFVFSVDKYSYSSNFVVNYFKENSKLYYVNALNDAEGNLYFEFWGENDNIRYFIGKSFDNEESILFNNDKIFSINSNIPSKYHESIIIEFNNNINIFSFDFKYINYINIKTGEISSKEIKDLVSPYYPGNDYFSLRNSLIKLKNNNYLFSIVIQTDCTAWIFCDYDINLKTFHFLSDNVDGFNVVNYYKNEVEYSNSTECFQTKNLFVECLYVPKSNSGQFTIFIFNQDLIILNTGVIFGQFSKSTFTKIFHINGEIGAYIFFDENDNDEPKIFFCELNNNDYTLYDLFEFDSDTSNNHGHHYINLNQNYIFKNCLFCSDAIKINDSKFVVILSPFSSNNLIVYLFDIYNDNSCLRLREYNINIFDLNIKIAANLKSFAFKSYFGVIFYNSNIDFPGFLFFNYFNITSNAKTNATTIEIKIFVDSSEPFVFPFLDHFKIINNIYSEMEKIQIINYLTEDKTGVIIKSSGLNAEISSGQILDTNDALIFEQSSGGAIPGNHILEFVPITYISEEYSRAVGTHYYGNAQESDFSEIQYFSDEIYKIIYIVECYEKCKTCTQLGDESFYYCTECLEDNFNIINNGEKCMCEDHKYINEHGQESSCLLNCNEGLFEYIKSTNDKYCLLSCEYNGEQLYEDESNHICYKDCQEAFNGNNYLHENKCVHNCPDNYIPNDNGLCIYEQEATTQNTYNTYYEEKSDTIESTIFKEYQKDTQSLIETTEKIFISTYQEIKENKEITNLDNNYISTDKATNIHINKKYEILDELRNNLTNNFNTTYLDNGNDIVVNDKGIIYSLSSWNDQKVLEGLKLKKQSVVDLTECENILSKNNIIQENQNLYILQIDIQIEGMLTPKVEYEVYNYPPNSGNLSLLNLSPCENTRINIYLSINISQKEIEKYNTSSSYYNDICYSFTADDGTDIHLKDRQNEYNENNMTICEEGCEFTEFDYNSGKAVCSCLTKTKMEKISEISDMQIDKERLHYNFKKIVNIVNLELIKCAYLLFTTKEFFTNIANYIMLIIFIMSIVILTLFISRDNKKIKKLVGEIVLKRKEKEKETSKEKEIEKVLKKKKSIRKRKKKKYKSSQTKTRNLNLSKKDSHQTFNSKLDSSNENHIKNISSRNINANDKESKINFNKTIKNKNDILNDTKEINKINPDAKTNKEAKIDILSYNDSEMNLLPYDEAMKTDQRTYTEYYLSLLRTKHILLFTFYKGNDYNLRVIKVYLFFFTFAINYSVSILFYNYDTMHTIYVQKGVYDFIYQIPKIIYSSIITGVLSALVTKLGLCESEVLKIKSVKIADLEEQKTKGLKIIFYKFVIFFGITYVLLIFFWIYSVSFCVVYKNTQIHLLKDVVVSFSTSFIKPFIKYLLPGIFRMLALKKGKKPRKWLYKFSLIIQMF